MDSDQIKPGLKAEVHRKVIKKLSVAPRGPGAGYVLSSPSMIGLMENTCVQALRPYMPEGYATVGYHVDVRHSAPTPLGEQVRVTAELNEVDGNKLLFLVEAFYGEKRIGSGLHRRAIIPIKPPTA
jgi:fluoroacetyl-CoA thioesterase